ncbi:glycosyl transferase [Enterovibrio norvegicus FF-33]|uniref:glycosyltransferase family 2 protein n=1 Tax=Enterovibrio norvegicus TaxID=188144 RepID=UPI0002E0C074|nr:glycosyltransferase family 2 protein [Enterovibrio norvegicus]OEE68078.1 glycosyl transferase [Enterovibrio norvegicus FF-33]
MKVSIITATYNSAKTITDTLRSLELQTYPDIEYIIVDGNSSDETLEIISKNCTRISKVISEPDNGIYDALNKGIRAATGDIVGFLHSDDLFAYEDAVADIVSTIKESNADAVYSDLQYVDKLDTNKVLRYWKSKEYKRESMKYGWMPPHPTFYMKKSLYEEHGLFDLSYKIAADYDSLLRYLWKGEITLCYVPTVTIKMRVGGASNRSISNIIHKTKEDIRALNNSEVPWAKAILVKNLSKIPQFFKSV